MFLDKEEFYCQLFDMIQQKAEFRIKFTKYMEHVPVLTRLTADGSTAQYASIYVGNAYALYLEGMTSEEIAEATIEKLQQSRRSVDATLNSSVIERNFYDIKDRLFIAEAYELPKHDLLDYWTVGDLCYTYYLDISLNKDYSIVRPVSINTFKKEVIFNENLFEVACKNMSDRTKVLVDGVELRLYEAIALLDSVNGNTSIVIMFEFKPEFINTSILVMTEVLKLIGAYIGGDYWIYPGIMGCAMIFTMEGSNIEQRVDYIKDASKVIFNMYERQDLQHTGFIYYYNVKEERLYAK